MSISLKKKEKIVCDDLHGSNSPKYKKTKEEKQIVDLAALYD